VVERSIAARRVTGSNPVSRSFYRFIVLSVYPSTLLSFSIRRSLAFCAAFSLLTSTRAFVPLFPLLVDAHLYSLQLLGGPSTSRSAVYLMLTESDIRFLPRLLDFPFPSLPFPSLPRSSVRTPYESAHARHDVGTHSSESCEAKRGVACMARRFPAHVFGACGVSCVVCNVCVL
jgi:hypothetical protein